MLNKVSKVFLAIAGVCTVRAAYWIGRSAEAKENLEEWRKFSDDMDAILNRAKEVEDDVEA